MNNNFVKFAFVGIACAAFCTVTFAAPKGGNHGGNGRPARAAQQTRTPQAARPAAKPTAAPKTARPAAKPTAAAPKAARPVAKPTAAAPKAARPAAKPGMARHAEPARHVNKPAVAMHDHARPAPKHHATPPRAVRHHIPKHAHYCAKPAIPLWRVGALRAWEWIEEEWLIIVNGVYYYGDGYYYDGYNYYYNGAYHTAPPVPIYV